MKIALLVEPASMSAPLKQFPKVISIRLTPKLAPIAEHALMYAL